mmetsp:Transcript_12079/g.50827  ORF Transcript_12079/g.50827 Transcript_12079/m.50827 type:complete len:222 (+) Transcript_12079:1420-2085(+)
MNPVAAVAPAGYPPVRVLAPARRGGVAEVVVVVAAASCVSSPASYSQPGDAQPSNESFVAPLARRRALRGPTPVVHVRVWQARDAARHQLGRVQEHRRSLHPREKVRRPRHRLRRRRKPAPRRVTGPAPEPSDPQAPVSGRATPTVRILDPRRLPLNRRVHPVLLGRRLGGEDLPKRARRADAHAFDRLELRSVLRPQRRGERGKVQREVCPPVARHQGVG